MDGTIRGTSKLSSKLQVTIPKDVREILNLQSYDRVVFREEAGRVYIEKA